MTYEPVEKSPSEKREITKLKRKANFGVAIIYSTLVTLVIGVALGFGGIWYVQYMNQKWCAVITVFDDAYREQPPSPPGDNASESAKQNYERQLILVEAFRDLRTSFNCE